jgi:adenylate cyclase class IV
MMEQDKTLAFHEVEVKFRMDEAKLNDWKAIVRQHSKDNSKDFVGFVYLDSDDVYYTKESNDPTLDYEFVRYRFSTQEKRAELTTKKKLKDSNNIIRKEQNVRVDNNSLETINEFITEGLGYEYNFKITKYVSIYIFKDATLPWYTVVDENGNRQTFLEIEVNEQLLHKITEEEAWEIIRKYEKILEPLAITPRNRLKKSLFEMYKK